MVVLNTNLRNTRNLSIEDAQQAIQFKQVGTPNYRYVMHRLSGFAPDQYTDMEYDLAESSRIIDTEAFVAETFRKKRQLIIKNGFVFDGSDKKNIEYINKRLEEFEYVSQQTFRDFLYEVVENMVNYNNCFILKLRKEDSSSGEIRSIPSGKTFKPIASLYVLASPTIDTANHPKTGKIVKYRHRVNEKFSRTFNPSDIYHLHENRRTGMTIGTPPLEAVKDDIIALRGIEQRTEEIIQRNASPFIHVRVGNDNQPARLLGDGTSEVDIYSSIIDNMEDSGGVATPHRVDIKQLGSESQALRLEGYLNYFKARVLAGLSISEADLGGSQEGDGVYESLREDVRAYQTTIAEYITNYIFTEMLLESPRYRGKVFIPKEERVSFKFIEADEDRRIKLESHALNLFISGLITKEAAIRGTQYKKEDLAPDPVIEDNSINKNNSVKSSITNNVVSHKNQYTEKLSVKDNVAYENYFDYDVDMFKEKVFNSFPEDLFPRTLITHLYTKALDIRSKYSLNYTNKFITNVLEQWVLDN